MHSILRGVVMKNLKEIILLLENAKEIITVEAKSLFIVCEEGFCAFTLTMEEAEKDINEAYFLLHSFADEAMTEEYKDEKKIRMVLYDCDELVKIIERLKRSPFKFKNVMTSLNNVITDLKNLRMEGLK